MNFTRTLLFSSLVSLGALPAAAQDGFRLSGPEMQEAHERARALTLADLNGDGTADVAAISNDEAVLHLWFHDPESEEAEGPFRHEEITLDTTVLDAAALDATGDGRTDLVMAAGTGRAWLMVQSEEGHLRKGRELPFDARYVLAEDMNGDGVLDLVAVSGRTWRVLTGGDDGITVEREEVFYAPSDVISAPMALDLKGNGRPDLAAQTASDTVVVFFQNGGFPAAVNFTPGGLRSLAPLRRTDGADLLTAVHASTRQLLLMELGEPSAESPDGITTSDPLLIGFDPKRVGDTVRSAVADVDGDGLHDIVMAVPDSATMRVLYQTESGELKPEDVPGLRDVTQIIPWPAEEGENTPLLLLSGDEKALAIARARDGERLPQFPRPLALGGQPFAAGFGGFTGDDAPDLVAILKGEEDATYAITAWPDFDASATSPGEGIELFLFSGMQEEPAAMRVLDLNGDGRDDALVFFEFRRPAVLVQSEDGTLVELDTAGILEGMLEGSSEDSVRPVRLAGSEGDLLMIVKDEFARAFRLNSAGGVEIERQFLSEAARPRLRAAIGGAFSEEGARDIAMFDSADNTLTFFSASGEENVYEQSGRVEMDSDYRSLETIDLDGDGLDDVIALASGHAAVIYTSTRTGELDTLANIETEVEEGGYGRVWTVDLHGDGTDEAAVVEMKRNVLEFYDLATEEDVPTFEQFYRFRVFDSESSMAQRVNLDAPPEPRELKAADVTGDGVTDLIALVHDYVIVYPGTAR